MWRTDLDLTRDAAEAENKLFGAAYMRVPRPGGVRDFMDAFVANLLLVDDAVEDLRGSPRR